MNNKIIFTCYEDNFEYAYIEDKNYFLIYCRKFDYQGNEISGIVIPSDNAGINNESIKQGKLMVASGDSAVKTVLVTVRGREIEKNFLEVKTAGIAPFNGSFVFQPNHIGGGNLNGGHEVYRQVRIEFPPTKLDPDATASPTIKEILIPHDNPKLKQLVQFLKKGGNSGD